MDKRLLKSLTTHKSRYENQIGVLDEKKKELQTKLNAINEMLSGLKALEQKPNVDESTEDGNGYKEYIPSFIAKKA